METTVKEVMIQDVKTVDKKNTVSQAVKVMNQYEIGSVIVTEGEKPVGILTERDILRRIVFKKRDPATTKIHKVMSNPLVTVNPNSKIIQAAHLMLESNIKKLVVANGNKLVGILSLTDLLPLLEIQDSFDELAFKKAPNHVKKAFQIYYDPVRQLRKTCPLTMGKGLAISCLGSKCMWYLTDRCGFLTLIEKLSR